MNRFQQNILLVLCLIVLITYASVSFFIFPYADDFTYALKGQLPNFVETVLKERQTWNGRYISNFILIGSPLNWGGLTGYRLMSILLIILSWLGLYIGLRRFKLNSPFFLANIILCTTISSLPDTGEGLYWLSGAWTYIPASILLFLLFSILFAGKFDVKNYLTILVLIFIGSGFNELFALISLLLIAVKFYDSRNKWVLALLIVQLGLFYYVWSAPGNDYRSSLFNNNHQIINSLKLTGMYSVRFIGEWMLNPLVYLLGYIFITDSKFEVEIPVLRKPISIGALLITPILIACFGPIWSTGILGQHRTPNMSCFLFFPLLFLVLIANKSVLFKYLKEGKSFVFPLIVVVLLGWKNNYFLFEDLISGQLSNYSNQLANRVELLENCKSEECFVPMLLDEPNTFSVYKLEANPEHWKNKSYRLFYNSGKVIPIVNR